MVAVLVDVPKSRTRGKGFVAGCIWEVIPGLTIGEAGCGGGEGAKLQRLTSRLPPTAAGSGAGGPLRGRAEHSQLSCQGEGVVGSSTSNSPLSLRAGWGSHV